jgi:hypothetical protein
MGMPDNPSMTPDFFMRAWKFTLFAAAQGAMCLLLSVLVGLLHMQAETTAGKVNEFAGMYLVIGLWLAPFYWLLATPAHLYFYIRRQAPSSYVLSFLASGCVVLVGSALMSWLASTSA